MVSILTKVDVRAALDLVYDVCSEESPDPFPLPVLERLGRLVGANAVGYCESPLSGCDGCYSLVTRPAPPWLYEELVQWGEQDLTHEAFNASSTEPIAISDFLSWRAFSRLEVYERICRRQDVADSMRLYLPPTPTEARFFFFDKERRGFGPRERSLLELLRPHLVLWRRRWGAATDPAVLGLTRREAEMLVAVASGATNREIAERFWISPHTVRTHLAHVFEKLDVSTRTQAVAVLRRNSL
jgi:DNA-binding CsgD family transcriptional regulator